jgi:anthranilate phosphoribosyltransferase
MPLSRLQALTGRITSAPSLSHEEATQAAHDLANETLPAADKVGFLKALHTRGETPVEVAAFAAVFRSLATDPGLGAVSQQAVDIVGTGGDGSSSFNISTTAALLVAASGVPVIKHGNRSITSKCGSADFLEALGVDLSADAQTQRTCLAATHFCFLFAPHYHPAFRVIGPVRKQLAAEGYKTIFNLLGPLVNPARPAHTLMGVYDKRWVSPLADAFEQLQAQGALVVHCTLDDEKQGSGCMDELSTSGSNTVAGSGRHRDVQGSWTPADFGLSPAPFNDLRGGDVQQNLELLQQLMAGTAPQGLIDTVCWNAGAALWVAGRSTTVAEGIACARETLTQGRLADWLNRIRSRRGLAEN